MILKTFVLVDKNKVTSPALVTIRCYGEWMKEVFDEYTVKSELYMKSKEANLNGSSLQWHPGTRIGEWFDHNTFNGNNMQSWYVEKDSYAIERLVKMGLADRKDVAQVKNKLRLYTVKQIEVYIRSNIDKSFSMARYVQEPIQVHTKDGKGVLEPKFNEINNTLF